MAERVAFLSENLHALNAYLDVIAGRCALTSERRPNVVAAPSEVPLPRNGDTHVCC